MSYLWSMEQVNLNKNLKYKLKVNLKFVYINLKFTLLMNFRERFYLFFSLPSKININKIII